MNLGSSAKVTWRSSTSTKRPLLLRHHAEKQHNSPVCRFSALLVHQPVHRCWRLDVGWLCVTVRREEEDKGPIQRWECFPTVKPTVWFCLCPENEVIEETKQQRYKDVSHRFLDLKREQEHSRHRRSTGEIHTGGPHSSEPSHIPGFLPRLWPCSGGRGSAGRV